MPKFPSADPKRGASVLLRLVGLVLLALVVPGAAAAQTYEATTRVALSQLGTAEAAVQVGDVDAARSALDGIGRSLSVLASQALTFREKANQERERCVGSVAGLDQRIGEIRTQEEALNQQIGTLNERLAYATEQESESQRTIQDLSSQLAAVQASLAERNAKLAELEDWWWVPGYGAYLGIRTLADRDIEEASSLSNTINDQQVHLSRNVAAMQEAQALRAQLDAQRVQQFDTQQQLSRMREQTAGRMSELRATASFLASAEVFWGKAEQLVRLRAQEKLADLEMLLGMLGQDLTLTDFNTEYRPEATTLEEALIEFARSIDRRTNFLLEETTEYCGGPSLPDATVAMSRRCDVGGFTQHSEIVDPVACSFREVSPPPG